MRMRKKKHCDTRLEACAALWVKEPETMRGRWHTAFENDNPIHIEIGCGKGQFLAEMAAQNPDVNYVGIDVIPDVLVLALEKAQARGNSNLRFMIGDAARILEYFAPGEAERIYLNFSTPWKKNKQAKRRLTHPNFLKLYKQLLQNGDWIYFKTDNRPLFEFSLNTFAAENFKLQNITLDLHHSKYEGNVVTEYEARFVEQGLPIYRLEATYLGWNT